MTTTIIRATRASAAHLATAQRHGRAMLDARRRGDTAEAQRFQRLRDQAYARHEKARAATLFPWEI
jgi:hypothetical protein